MPSARWRRLDAPGTDEAELNQRGNDFVLGGRARFRDPSGAFDVQYRIDCDETWRTRRAEVAGTGPDGPLALEITADTDGNWWLNGSPQPAVHGCVDLDLAFTPATNLLSIRRLALRIGEEAEVMVAWLDFPASRLLPLRQIYSRDGSHSYRYRSPQHDFESLLDVDEYGFVRAYPPLWVADS